MLYWLPIFIGLAFGVIIDKPTNTGCRNWRELGKTDGSKDITLSFWLKNQNIDVLHDTLMEVSTPGHKRYGQFLTQEEVQTIVAPKKESIATVKSWLERFGFEPLSASRNSEVFKVKTTISKAEELLQAEYYDYEAVNEPGFIVYRIRLGTNYEVPSQIASHLDLVTPTHRLPQRNLVRRSITKGSKVGTNVGLGPQTPTTLKKLYNVGTATGKSANNSQSICSFQLEYYDSSDLQQFWTTYGITQDTVINVPSNTPSGYGLEAELDTQYISSLGEKVPLQVWYNSGAFEDALLSWTSNAMNDPDCPLLFSVSYGTTESYYGGSYINKLNTQLMELGATGVSIFFASGDSGAGGGCTTPPFEPDYPASSPYVTAVGGVQDGSANANGAAVGEECWNYGGGGFSNYAPRQSWQDSAVTKYLSTYASSLPSSADYNSSGRAFPDISAQSVDFEIVVRGRTEGVSGTSCASPTAAGIFALLNDLRLQNGMAQLGFANPWIYQTAAANPTAFNDCVTGYNKGCLNAKGFPAEPAWDACSGYGSPNYGVLATHVLATGVPARKF